MGDDGKVVEGNMISREVQRELYERVVIPTVVYGSDTWALSAQERRKIEIFEKHMWHKESGQSEKRNNKREVRV